MHSALFLQPSVYPRRRDRVDRRRLCCARPPRGFVPQRRHLARAPQGIGRHARVALPRLRRPDRAPRQRPAAVVARAAGSLPALPGAHLGAVPLHRAGMRRALRRARSALLRFVGAARVPALRRGPARHLGDRPRALHHPEPHRVSARVRVGAAARARRRARRGVVVVRARAHRRRVRVHRALRDPRGVAPGHGLRRRAARSCSASTSDTSGPSR